MPHAHITLAFEGCSHTDPNFIPLMLASLVIFMFYDSYFL